MTHSTIRLFISQNCTSHLNGRYIKLLKESQNTQNWFVDFGQKTSAGHLFKGLKQALTHSSPVMDYASFKKLLNNFKPEKPKDKSILSPVEYTPKNEINTAVDIIEEIALALDNTAILSLFRKYPLIATANFILSCTTLASFQAGLHSNQFLAFMQTIMAKLSKAYFGKDTIEGFNSAMFSCFLFWQLNLAATDMGLQLLENGQIDWLNYIIQHPDQLVIASSAIVGLGMGLAFIPTLPTTINLPYQIKIPNIFTILINSITDEARPCLEGILPFNQVSLSFMGLKTSLFFLNFFSSGPSEDIETLFLALILDDPTILQKLLPYLPKEISDSNQPKIAVEHVQTLKEKIKNSAAISTLLKHFMTLSQASTHPSGELYRLLNLLENKHPIVMEALKHKEFACQYFQDLHQAFHKYNQEHPKHPLDPNVILPAFYNQYCQSRLINILRMFTIVLFPLHLLQWAYGYLCKNSIHEHSGRKKNAEDLFILLKLLLAILHPLFTAMIIFWNYVILSMLRLPGFVIRVCTEQLLKIFSWVQAFQSLLFYTSIVDDWLKSLKLHHLMGYLIQPLQVIYANIAYYSGRYGELSLPCKAMTEIIENQHKKTQESTNLGLSA